MNFLTLTSRVEKDLLRLRRLHESGGIPWDDKTQRELADKNMKYLMTESFRYEEMYKQLREEAGLSKTTGTYTLDIRPPPETPFADFQNFANHFFDRTPITDYIYVYEQKGTTPETLGHGFHIHAVLKATWRSNMEYVRSAQSSMDKFGIPHLPNITIVCNRLKSDKDVRNKIAYMTEGQSKDGHKETTFAHDINWRNITGLNQKYTKGAYQDETAP